jgi:hypothetical protein
MKIFEFIIANIIVILGAIAFTRCFRIVGILEGLMSTFAWYVAQIIGTLLLAGGLLGQLNAIALLLINLVVSAGLFGLSLKIGSPLSRDAFIQYSHRWNLVIRELFATSWSYIMLILVIVEVIWLGLIAVIEPPHAYDGVTYHLVAMTTWLQAGHFAINPNYFIYSNAYPFNTELMFTWLVIFLHSAALVDLGQLILSFGGMLGLASICRTLGLKPGISCAAGALYLFAPIVLAQAATSYVDVGFASMFLLFFAFAFRYMYTLKPFSLFLAGICAGITLGMKASSAAYISITVVALIIRVALYHYKSFEMFEWKPFLLKIGRFLSVFLGIFVVPLLLLGTYWYLRDWVIYGNPTYPLTFTIFGHTLFPGLGSVQSIILADSNVPPIIRGQSWWYQVFISWTSDPPLKDGFNQFKGQYLVDQHLGGFGVQWTYLEFPALIIFSVYTFLKERMAFWYFIFPFVAIFLLQPGNWWSRYTIFFIAPGIVAICYGAQHIRWWGGREFLKGSAVLLSLISIFFATTQGFFAAPFVASILSTPKVEWTYGRIIDSEFLWVDAIPNGSRIGTPAPDGEHYAFFPLFGSRLENKVYIITAQSKDEFEQIAQADHIQYYFTLSGTTDAQWADEDPTHFRLIDTTRNNRVYEVSW